jgi:hypothetical protein
MICGIWFLYDGYVAWPRERAIARQFKQFQNEGRTDQWPAFAIQHGWPDGSAGTPGKDYSDLDLIVQKVLGYALVALSLILGAGFVRTLGRWICLDEQGFTTSWGSQFAMDAIKDIQLDRWQSKGIAVIIYDRKDRKNKLVLDDWKYDRQATIKMVEHVKEHLGITEPKPPSETSM